MTAAGRVPRRIAAAARGLARAAACGAWLVVVACARSSEAPSPADRASATSASPAPAASEAVPADHLGPDELVEGTEKAFGVPLPRGVAVEHRYVDTVQATGQMSVHALVKYFHARLRGGSLREGPEAATFEHVIQPDGTDAELTVHVEAGRLGTVRLDVTSFKHEHPPPIPDETARWRSVGLTPNGKVLDPRHFE